MKNIFYSLCSIFICCNLFSQNLKDRQNLKMEIVFQDYFKNDTITLKVNNITIVNKAVISSNDIGFSQLQYDFTENSIVSRYDKQKKYSPLLTKLKFGNIVYIKVLYNSAKENFRVNLKKGKHIGFDISNRKLKINQSKKAFMYD